MSTSEGDAMVSMGRPVIMAVGLALTLSGCSGEGGSVATRVITGPWSASGGRITLTIDQIDDGKIATVRMHVRNAEDATVMLPVSAFFLIDSAGTSYPVNVFGTGWRQEVPPSTDVSGTVQVKGPIAPSAVSLQAGFSRVYGTFDVDNIKVSGITVGQRPAG
jgi:hypothetical protein